MRLSPWGRVVAISALLVVGGAVALAVGGARQPRAAARLLPGHRRARRASRSTSATATSRSSAAASATRSRSGAPSATRSAASPRPRAASTAGVFTVTSRCPTSLLAPCTVAYRVVVPDNVALDIRTTSGKVALRDYRGTAKVATDERRDRHRRLLRQRARRPRRRRRITLDAICAPPRTSLRAGVGRRARDAARRPLRHRRREHVRRRARARHHRRATTRRTPSRC